MIQLLYSIYVAVMDGAPMLAGVQGKSLDGLPMPFQQAWLAWGQVAPNIVGNGEGLKLKEVASRLLEAWEKCLTPTTPITVFSSLPLVEQLAWEAVARQLAAIVDESETVEDLEDQQRDLYWRDWAKQRLPQQLVKEST